MLHVTTVRNDASRRLNSSFRRFQTDHPIFVSRAISSSSFFLWKITFSCPASVLAVFWALVALSFYRLSLLSLSSTNFPLKAFRLSVSSLCLSAHPVNIASFLFLLLICRHLAQGRFCFSAAAVLGPSKTPFQSPFFPRFCSTWRLRFRESAPTASATPTQRALGSLSLSFSSIFGVCALSRESEWACLIEDTLFLLNASLVSSSSSFSFSFFLSFFSEAQFAQQLPFAIMRFSIGAPQSEISIN